MGQPFHSEEEDNSVTHRTQKDNTACAILGACTVAAGAFWLYYLLAGPGRRKNAALIPDAIEDRIDAVVEALDARFGKNWVNLGLGALQAGLRKVLPGPLVG